MEEKNTWKTLYQQMIDDYLVSIDKTRHAHDLAMDVYDAEERIRIKEKGIYTGRPSVDIMEEHRSAIISIAENNKINLKGYIDPFISLLEYVLYPNEQPVNKYLEFAEFLLLFLKSSEVQISTTIKGIKHTCKLNHPACVRDIFSTINENLTIYKDSEYCNIFGWKKRLHSQTSYNNLSEEEKGKYRVQRHYTQEELERIITYEKEQLENSKDSKIKFADRVRFVIAEYRFYRIFDTSTPLIRTREAIFMYDVMCLLKIIEDDGTMSNQEKYQKIKEYIRSTNQSKFSRMNQPINPKIIEEVNKELYGTK